MGLRETIFGKRREPKQVTIPAIMQPENPVNYDTVLDWLLGLSDKDYKTMQEVVNVYREAGKTTAKLLKIKDTPSTELLPSKPTDDEVEAQLDGLLETHPDDLKAALENEVDHPVAKSKQNKAKQIAVSEE